MIKTKTNRFISMLLTLAMLCSVFMSAVPVSAATTHNCGNAADCLVCEVAGMINALPAAEDITIDNAATVTNQIHAIDRIKYDLTDAEYEELLTLVEIKTNDAGSELAEPVRYMNAVEAINTIGGGGWFVVSKSFTAGDGSVVDVTDAEVEIKITNTQTGAVAAELTLATLGTEVSALGADYYTANADGWTYKYQLPAGTYEITEVSDSGATVDGQAFVTGSVSYNGVTAESITVSLNDGETSEIAISNSVAYAITVDGEIQNGKVEADMTAAASGTTVTLTVTPNEGYVVGSVTVTDADSANVEVTKSESNDSLYTFTMPNNPVTVSATFVEESSGSTTLPAGTYTFGVREYVEETDTYNYDLTGVSLELWQCGEETDTLLVSNEDNGATSVTYALEADTEYFLNYSKPGYDNGSGTVWFTLADMTDYFTEVDGVYYVDMAKIKTWYFYFRDTADNPVGHVYADFYKDEDMTPLEGESVEVETEDGHTDYWTFTPDEWVEELYLVNSEIQDETGNRAYEPLWTVHITEQESYFTVYKWMYYNYAGVDAEDSTELSVTIAAYYRLNDYGEWEWHGSGGADYIEGDRYKVILEAYNASDETVEYKPIAIEFTAGSLDDAVLPEGCTYEYDEETDYYNISNLVFEQETAEKVEYTVKLLGIDGKYTGADVSFDCATDFAYNQITYASWESGGTVELASGVTYNVSVKVQEYTMVEPTDYSLSFIAGGDGTELSEDPDDIYTIDNENKIITINVTYIDEYYTPVGDATVTINFVDRDGQPLVVSGEYGFSHPYEEATNVIMGEFEDTDTLELSNLGEGEFTITISSTAKPEEGYQAMVGWICFYVDAESIDEYGEGTGCKLVIEDVVDEETGETTAYAPDAMPHIVKEYSADTGSITVEVSSFEVEPRITSPGLGYDFPYELYDSEGTVIYSDSMAETSGKSGIYLAPGRYTYKIRPDATDADYLYYAQYVNVPENDKGVTFDVEYNEGGYGDEVYTISLVGEYGEIINVLPEYDPKLIIRYLEPKDAMEVTANVNLSSGTEFNSGATVSLYLRANTYVEEDELVYSVEIPEGSTEFSKTWTVQAHTVGLVEEPAVEDPENPGLDPMPQVSYEAVENEYYVVYEDWENGTTDLTSTAEEPNVFSASVPGFIEDDGKYGIVVGTYEGGTVTADMERAYEGDEVTLTVAVDSGYELSELSLKGDNVYIVLYPNDEGETETFTFTMPDEYVSVDAVFAKTGEDATTYPVNIKSSVKNGTVTANKTSAAEGEEVTLTVTPDATYNFESITVTDADGNPVARNEVVAEVALFALPEPEVKTFTFAMPASEVTVDATFTRMTIASPFTVKAAVNDQTVDVDANDAVQAATALKDVHSGDKVYVDVIVDGADYTNASWTLVYDSSKFKYVGTAQNVDYGTLGYYTLDDSNADGNVLTGKISGVAGNDKKTDEFTGGVAVVTYEFEALPQSKAVTGKFAITSAYANTYEMAGIQNDTPAATESTEVSIVLVEDTDNSDETTPAGTFEDKTVTYNALEQSGNEFVLDTDFADATVTYYAKDDGTPVEDSDGNGVIDAKELDGLTFRTGLPAWTNVGSYTYYAKVSGDGLATIYDSAVLTIEPATLTPSANFAVDPDVNKVTIIPVLEGVVDGSHTGTVTVKFTDVSGTEQTQTLNASDFKYDGESTSVYTGAAIEVKAQASGTFTVTLDYTEGDTDNYTGDENTATVDVDKITFADTAALEAAITNVFPYDSTDHKVVVDNEALAAITDGKWTATTIVDAYDETISDPTVKNVGDEKLVKVVFTDSTGVYNDVVVYVVLKVTPADVRITIDNKTKAVGEDDPAFTYTLEVLDEDGNVVKTNELYSAEDLEALALELTREPGEAAGTYTITATYVPNANYNVAIENGKLEIGAPSTSGENPQVKIEVVDLSKGLTNGDVQPDYIADKRLILVYTNLDKAYYGYGDTAETAERMFDVTAAGYSYVDNDYVNNTYDGDGNTYDHVYGIVVDSIGGEGENPAEFEAQYMSKVIFLGSDAADAPENIVYDANINLTNELDINDYSMNNGIYNNGYDRTTYIRSILKADYNHDKVVNTDDSLAVKGIVDPAVAAR